MKDHVLIRIGDRDRYALEKDRLIGDVRADYENRFGEGGRRDWTIGRTDRGKPVFSGETDRFLSLSHSGRFFACAVSDGKVGLDIQEHQPGRYEQICRKWFHPFERAYLETWGYEHFFEVWTAKESFVKYTGMGMDEHFGAFYAANENGLVREIVFRGERAFLEHIPIFPGYSMCLCGEHEAKICTVSDIKSL